MKSIITNDKIKCVYGFGSFFRNEPFNDIDLLFVVSASDSQLAELHRTLCVLLIEIENVVGICIDFTVLTEKEFSSRPLRDHTKLVSLNN